MIYYDFVIEGNQEKKHGNPMPYFRRTQGSLWSKGAQRYAAWVQYVRRECYMQTTLREKWEMPSGRSKQFRYAHPFELLPMQKARMDIVIYFADEAHADPDNIFKGLADALFKNDKHLVHSTDYVHDPERNGRVAVNITIMEVEAWSTPATEKGKRRLSGAL
jgi:Holliday junction resolvase RusA-like endonuclease